jgi:poly(A) polymerase
MTASLGVRSWMSAAPTLAVLDALEARGGAGCARFVGGSVRNALLDRPVDDIDIATALTPDQVIEALSAAGLKAVPTGVEHGTVTAVAGGRPYEITTLRRDVATDGRRAVVAFTTDWDEDARRRDFTLNALYADRDGTIFDPTGRGVADGQAGRIVFVGDPETRLREDHLRILRFFRFQAWYGRGEPDAAALAACAALKGEMGQLAAERISKELLKLLAAEDPRGAVALMAQTGVLAKILPEAQDLARLDRLVQIAREQQAAKDPLLRLAALLPDDPMAGADAAQRLRLSNDQRDRLTAALGQTPEITSVLSAREVRQAVYRLGNRAFADRVILAWASAGITAATPWREALALGEAWTPPALPVTGDEALQAGATKGPMVGQALREVEAWWLDHDFVDDKPAALRKLKAVVEGLAR